MDHSREMDETFSEIIPNPAGVPGKRSDSEKVRNGLRSWRKTSAEAQKSTNQQSYWQTVSACSAL